MEDRDEKSISPLDARAAFWDMLESAEGWARAIWKKILSSKSFIA